MPNAKVLEEKKALVASLVEKIKNSPAGVLVDYKGINVEDDTKLRRQLREAGVEYADHRIRDDRVLNAGSFVKPALSTRSSRIR